MARCIVRTAEEILDKEFSVLNHGFVRLVDYMGGDERIAQAARVSYGKGTKSIRRDRGLIRYLLRHRHTSPFEQVVLTFHAKMPIFVARQWVRHRTARLNEISGRYSVMKDETFLPQPEDIGFQDNVNRQGRTGEFPAEEAEKVIEEMKEACTQAYQTYTDLIDKGMAREIARTVLPLSLYTEWYWQIDLHNLFHFLSLRLDPHAQKEIRVYAEVMARIAKAVAPIAFEAFEDYVLNAVSFSREEMRLILQAIDLTKIGLAQNSLSSEEIDELGAKVRQYQLANGQEPDLFAEVLPQMHAHKT